MADIRAAFLATQHESQHASLPAIEDGLPLLVLDLDGSILDTAPVGVRGTRYDFAVSGQETRLRPGLGAFLTAVRAHGYELAVWTAASNEYAERVVAGIDEIAMPGFKLALKCVFTDEHTACKWERGRLLRTKDLRSMASHCRVPLRRCLILDDTPETYRLNVRNALPVPEWRGEVSDRVLGELQAFLCSQPIGADAVLDVSAWTHAPKGAGPLTKEATEGQTLGSTSMFIGGGVPRPAWSNRPPASPRASSIESEEAV